MVTLHIYVEGGGASGETNNNCRRAFSTFLSKFTRANSCVGVRLEVVALGGRADAFNGFLKAVNRAYKESSADYFALLIDAEAAMDTEATIDAWRHLQQREGWVRPQFLSDYERGRVFLMVQCMETWLVADKANLAAYFGAGFRHRALPTHQDIEQVSCKEVISALQRSVAASKKRRYDKGKHSFALLQTTSPLLVYDAAMHSRELFDWLLQLCQEAAR